MEGGGGQPMDRSNSIVIVSSDDASESTVDHSPRSYFKSWIIYKKKPIIAIATIVIVAVVTVSVLLTRRPDNEPSNISSLYAKHDLPYFTNESILNGYGVCADLQSDLEKAARFLVDVRIDRDIQMRFYERWDYNMWIPRGGFPFGDDIMVMEESVEDTASKGAPTGGGEDSFGTNNQVNGVDEADLIKSDGIVVYAAYGDQIVIWDAATGIELSRTVLPTEDENGVGICSDDDDASTNTRLKKKSSPCYTSYWSGGATISSLLLHDKRLVVIASAPFEFNENSRDDHEQILDNYHGTRVFTYDLTTIPSDKSALTLLGRKDLQGYYQTARSIDNQAHIVTKSNVRTWQSLEQHINVWNSRYDRMKENQYRQAAYEFILPYISVFAKQLTEEIVYAHGKDISEIEVTECSQIARVALMLNLDNKDNSTRPLSFTTEGVLNGYVQVHSFDIQESFQDVNEVGNSIVSTSHSGVFLPTASYTHTIYSSATKLIVSGNAYSENDNNEWQERTVLFAFDLIGGKAVAHSVGEVPGSVLNQFSMDHMKYDNFDDSDYIRVATTTWAQFGLVDDVWTQIEDSTNQVTVLKLPNAESNSTLMEVIGVASGMGLGERIYSARFIDEKGYVVTFRTIDPFYTLNLTDPSNPYVVGELKIPGFSNYLHPVNDDLILALGQDANDNGVILGLQIAMFNVSNFTHPTQIQKYVETGYSSSDAQYEHKAFRYLPESKLLILPLYIYSHNAGGYFDGFVVYDVDESKTAFSKKIRNIAQKQRRR
mmetsp:Transcript_4750/g.6989  ORF Transcript_4750/g.6989 Transcript_4750/m.6989 type:complete len:770 (+) Transcript_4750:95-2404(+)